MMMAASAMASAPMVWLMMFDSTVAPPISSCGTSAKVMETRPVISTDRAMPPSTITPKTIQKGIPGRKMSQLRIAAAVRTALTARARRNPLHRRTWVATDFITRSPPL